MAQKKIFITASIPEAGIELLHEKKYLVDVYTEVSHPSKEIIIRRLKEAHAMISLLSDTIDKEIIRQAPHLKIIANYAVGYNNIDLEAAAEQKIIVTNTPDMLTPATADLTWALILAVSKRIVESDCFMREGKFRGWQPKLFLGDDVSGRSLGIIGAGRIGQAVAERARGFNMAVYYYSKSRKPDFEKRMGAEFLALDQLLRQSDFISVHCPLTDKTHHLLNSGNMHQIKKGAFLINTARGPVVEEKAMIAVLQNGRLAGAGLDVYEFEPQISDELMAMKNVILLPHIGSGTVETRNEMSRICARNIIEVFNDRKPLTPVSF